MRTGQVERSAPCVPHHNLSMRTGQVVRSALHVPHNLEYPWVANLPSPFSQAAKREDQNETYSQQNTF